MTFDEANDVVVFAKDGTEIMMRSEQESWSDEGSRNATLKLIAELRKTYAPTIYMTQEQYVAVTVGYDCSTEIEDVLAAGGFIESGFDERFWSPLGKREVVSAWLHPELIKVVD